jgi:ligand-binding SRPBCC domain-containing protein
MHLKIKTVVKQNYLKVKTGFTKELFLSLNPPFPPVVLKEFGGCEKSDIVHLRLNFILFKQDWISEITYDRTDAKVFEFIDEGKKLPFFLKSWKHHHLVNNIDGERSEIVDDIHFKTPFMLMDYLMYPVLWLQFAYRKPIYRKLFSTAK